jgi:nucleoside 2-deoxyribosyltransferase
MKAYITCPVTLSQDRLNLLPLIKNISEENGLETFVFIVGGSPKEIFERDYSQIKSCDLIIADVSEPSHGVGIEIGFSYCLGLKRILLFEKGKKVTKLAQGMPNTILVEYSNIDDMKSKLKQAILGPQK